VEYPKPLGGFLYDLFDSYRVVHPWAADHNIRPKSVVRDLYQRAMGFGDYVAHYGVTRSEGLLLRYLSDAYKSLTRAIPEDSKTDELIDFTEWLGELVRQVDSSLLDEWELLRNPPPGVAAEHAGALRGAALAAAIEDPAPPPVTANRRAFRIMVANAVFRRVELLSRRSWSELAALGEATADAAAFDWEAAAAGYFEEHPSIGIGAQARDRALLQITEGPSAWRVRQVLDDPDSYREWGLELEVDLAASDEAGEPVLVPLGIERMP
jgi:hypothetical protein